MSIQSGVTRMLLNLLAKEANTYPQLATELEKRLVEIGIDIGR